MITKEIKVGILALVSMVILYVGFNFLKGTNIFSNTNNYYIVSEKIDNLTPSNHVTINGLVVGQVRKITLLQKMNNKLLITISVNKDIVVTEDSRAVLSKAFLGNGEVFLTIGKGKALNQGDTIQLGTEDGLMNVAMQKAPRILSNADSIFIEAKESLRKFRELEANLVKTSMLASQSIAIITSQLSSILKSNHQNITTISKNVSTLSSNLIETEKSIRPLIEKFNLLGDSLKVLPIKQTLQETQKTIVSLQKIADGLEKGQGTAGKLLKDDSLYVNLNKSLINLDKLLLDFRLAPKRYVSVSVFGRKATPPVVK